MSKRTCIRRFFQQKSIIPHSLPTSHWTLLGSPRQKRGLYIYCLYICITTSKHSDSQLTEHTVGEQPFSWAYFATRLVLGKSLFICLVSTVVFPIYRGTNFNIWLRFRIFLQITELPFGWEEVKDKVLGNYFIDHNAGKFLILIAVM